MPNKYSLIVTSGTNQFFLATRTNIWIEEQSDFQTEVGDQQVQCAADASCTTLNKFSTKFKLHFVGGCSLATAWTLFNTFKTFLNTYCNVTGSELILRRRVFDEPYLTWKVTKSSLRMTDIINQYTREHILTMEWSVDLEPWPPTGGTVVVGGRVIATFSPLFIGVTPVTPTINIIRALPVKVSIPTPLVVLS